VRRTPGIIGGATDAHGANYGHVGRADAHSGRLPGYACAGAVALDSERPAVRKIGHPWQPEYALGAVTPGDGVYVRASNGLTEQQVARAVATATEAAVALDRRLHVRRPAASLQGRTVLLVDDGLATGATMIAAARWARAAGAGRVVAVVPVAAAESAELVRGEVDDFVALYELASAKRRQQEGSVPGEASG
jgi:putative phosphoribosyl transferase